MENVQHGRDSVAGERCEAALEQRRRSIRGKRVRHSPKKFFSLVCPLSLVSNVLHYHVSHCGPHLFWIIVQLQQMDVTLILVFWINVHMMLNYKGILWIKDLAQCLCESLKRLTHLTAHSAIPLPCKTSRPLTVQFLVIVQTSKGIRCAPRFFNRVKDFFFSPFFSFLRRIVLKHENGRRGTAEEAHSAENIKDSQH